LREAYAHEDNSDGKETSVAYLHVGEENSGSIDLYYEDHGAGTPVVLIHGYLLSSQSWEKQVPILLYAGYRVIAYDRRGFGKSSQPACGYDYATLTRDLRLLMTTLDLRNAVLIGFAMGSGEVIRYLATYGSERISKAILIAPLQPFLLKTPDNPEGICGAVFDRMMDAIVEDRPACMKTLLDDYYNVDVLGGIRVSDQALQMNWNVAIDASATGSLDCIRSWLTDFRDDLPKIDVPILVVQGDQDRILPYSATGKRLPGLIKGAQFVVIEGGPHGIRWTHAEEVNQALLDFLGR
jgi:non-heme chloroperoxidase